MRCLRQETKGKENKISPLSIDDYGSFYDINHILEC